MRPEFRRERVHTRSRKISLRPVYGSDQVQANWFTAACATVRRYHMRGVFFFKVDLADNPAHPAKSLSTFEGRGGAGAISECAQTLH